MSKNCKVPIVFLKYFLSKLLILLCIDFFKITVLMGILFLYGCIQLGESLNLNEKRIKWFIFFTSCSPFFFYYSISVSPNLPALTWFVWGIALLIKYIDKPLWSFKYLLPITLITIGTLSKATYLFFGMSIAYIFIRKYNIFLM